MRTCLPPVAFMRISSPSCQGILCTAIGSRFSRTFLVTSVARFSTKNTSALARSSRLGLKLAGAGPVYVYFRLGSALHVYIPRVLVPIVSPLYEANEMDKPVQRTADLSLMRHVLAQSEGTL